MRKILLAVLIVIMLGGNSFAGSWSIRCTNNSCVAEQGALKVYWMSNSFSDTYSGKLTGVEGIPIAIDDYQAVEKKIESVIEKSITRKKGSDAGVKADTPEGVGGPTAGTTGTKENLFTKKKSMAQSKTMGKKVNVDYTLAFIEWLGDARYGGERSIRKYWRAAEDALDAYKSGNIESLIERFFIARNAGDIDNVAVNTKFTDENKDLVLTKYIGLTKYPGIADAQQRYALASSFVYDLSVNSYMADQAAKITEEFKNDLKSLEIVVKPNQTALKLYKTDKELAFAKWLADNNKFIESINKMRHEDKYLVAIRAIERVKNKEMTDTEGFFTQRREEFEAAIKNKDQSVQIVTIKGSPIPVIPIAVVVGSGLLAGVVIFARRRKKNNQEGVKDEA